MNDKSLAVLERYDINVSRMYRGRGGMLLATKRGLKLLYECDKHDRYYTREAHMTDVLCEYGFEAVDSYVRNIDGELITADTDGRRYILKNWFDAKECDVSDTDYLENAVRTLGVLHTCFNNISHDIDMFETYNTTKEAGECSSLGVGKELTESEAVSDSTEVTKYAEVVEDREVESCNLADASKDKRLKTTENLKDTYFRHMRELKKVQNYLRTKKHKHEFEQSAYKHIGSFYTEASKSVELLGSSRLLTKYEQVGISKEIMQGSYNYHNVLYLGDECAVTNSDRYKNECQICDLYQFMRKSLEKHKWNVRLGHSLIDAYDRMKPLSVDDYELLVALFTFPEKFWKIINQYYNASKSWIPAKDIDKLNYTIATNIDRREFIRSL